ncbi:MAG: UDP-N-acetylmuramyl-tripeptide synthetase, partial [Patescibacteria group bacterium]
GFKTGKITSVVFGVGEKEWENNTKHAMPGRFQLQKLLSQMAKAGCRYAVVETSSEGILQFRHRFIDYEAAVFTNLSPEHIERHGGFQSYRAAKLKLFEKIAGKKDGVGIFNLDDENAEYFLRLSVKNKIGYGLKFINPKPELQTKFQISNVKLSMRGTEFEFNGEEFRTPLIGEFNVYNAAAAISFALSQNIPAQKIREILKQAKPVPGRLEIVDCGQDFTVIVDYAHEPASLGAAYKAVKLFKPRKIIGLLGAQGGGRDKWKRAAMAKIAEKYCDEIIFTNEDPYDEEPMRIIDDMVAAIGSESGITSHEARIYKIVDRREAIQKAISLAAKGDAVI